MYHRTLPANETGRDFVFGDLHGCYQLLIDALAANHFDPEADRLFSVGDLVDRGPDSFRCLQLLKQPWFFAVAGNHEETLLGTLNPWNTGREQIGDYLANDGSWLRRLDGGQCTELTRELLPLLRALPLVIHVEDMAAPFNIVHAEAADQQHVFMDAELESNGGAAEFRGCLTWGRVMRDEYVKAAGEGSVSSRFVGKIAVSSEPVEPFLSLTYCGHSILPSPLLHRSHLFIDQGAYLGATGKLTVLSHRAVAADLTTAEVLECDVVSTF